MGWVGNYKMDVFNDAKAYERSFFGDWNTTYKVFDAWSTQNPNSEHPRVVVGDPNGNFKNFSSYFVEDASFLKLKSLHFGYTVPTSITEKFKVRDLKLFINCHNLLTISKFDGDPEIGGGYLERNTYSADRYPSTKSIEGGISLTF
jgi:hypothetical protein